ncbi:22289_t:CDS:2 [Entrophospora sp. SA101]|nr:22289_t:CDS:2 [Entrophospora sp. SA101]
MDWEIIWHYLNNNNMESISPINNDNLTNTKFELYTNNLITMETLSIRYPGIFTSNKCPIEGCQENEDLKGKEVRKEPDEFVKIIKDIFKNMLIPH